MRISPSFLYLFLSLCLFRAPSLAAPPPLLSQPFITHSSNLTPYGYVSVSIYIPPLALHSHPYGWRWRYRVAGAPRRPCQLSARPLWQLQSLLESRSNLEISWCERYCWYKYWISDGALFTASEKCARSRNLPCFTEKKVPMASSGLMRRQISVPVCVCVCL